MAVLFFFLCTEKRTCKTQTPTINGFKMDLTCPETWCLCALVNNVALHKQLNYVFLCVVPHSVEYCQFMPTMSSLLACDCLLDCAIFVHCCNPKGHLVVFLLVPKAEVGLGCQRAQDNSIFGSQKHVFSLLPCIPSCPVSVLPPPPSSESRSPSIRRMG